MLLSLNVPVAFSCRDVPGASVLELGLAEIVVNVAPLTVKVVEPETPPHVAEIVVVPALVAVAHPVLAIAATPLLLEPHAADCVRSRVLLSVNVPVAVKC